MLTVKMGCSSSKASKYTVAAIGSGSHTCQITTRTEKVKLRSRADKEYVNQYLLGDLLGHGAFGVVRKAQCKQRRAGSIHVAIKTLSKHKLKRKRVGLRKSALDMLAQEIAVWEKLDHPNVCNLIEIIDDPDHDEVYLVCEYIEGGMLLPDKREVDPIPEKLCKHYFRQILQGLSYLHKNNIAHRDIKPANIMLTEKNSEICIVKLVDFGVADMWEGRGPDNSLRKNTVGTMEFFSPEMCKEGGISFDVMLCDAWAAGVTLHLMITGKLPATGRSMEALFENIVNNTLEIEQEYLSLYSSEAFELLEGLLTKDPKLRWDVDRALKSNWFCQQEKVNINSSNEDAEAAEQQKACSKLVESTLLQKSAYLVQNGAEDSNVEEKN